MRPSVSYRTKYAYECENEQSAFVFLALTQFADKVCKLKACPKSDRLLL